MGAPFHRPAMVAVLLLACPALGAAADREAERLIKAGEKQSFTADHEVALNIGNAGAFTWTLNGKPARSLGPPGTTRAIRITRENVESFLQR